MEKKYWIENNNLRYHKTIIFLIEEWILFLTIKVYSHSSWESSFENLFSQNKSLDKIFTFRKKFLTHEKIWKILQKFINSFNYSLKFLKNFWIFWTLISYENYSQKSLSNFSFITTHVCVWCEIRPIDDSKHMFKYVFIENCSQFKVFTFLKHINSMTQCLLKSYWRHVLIS